jgi:hypothetical protein
VKSALWRACVALLVVGCEKDRTTVPDELTIVVQGDRSELESQEKSLREREESLKKDRARLEARIADLANGLKAAADAEQRRGLEQELRRNQDDAAQLATRATALEAQKTEVQAKKQAVEADFDRVAVAALQAREATVARREATIAERESQLATALRDLADRDRKLADRERDVALREKGVAALERQGPQVDARAGTDVNVPKAAAVESRHRKLLADLEARGVLMSDLPAEDQPLNADIYAARRQRDFVRAWDLLNDLTKAVAKVKVDQRFVEQKIGRLQGARASAKLGDAQRSEVERVLREVTSAFSDGKYDQANKGLNRLAVILDASAGSG